MGKKVSDIPHMLKMWDYKQNTEEPEAVSVNLEGQRHWKCPDCGYSWTSTVKARYRSSGKCPCHESNKVIMKGVNDALTIVKGLLDLLDEDNDLELLHTQGIDSSVPVNLRCRECGRKWTVTLKSQVRKDGNGGYVAAGCPHYNTVKRKKSEVPFCNEVESIYRFWDENSPMDPSKTKSNSTRKAHFICKNCGYDWTAEIRSQTRGTGKCKCCELQLVTKKGYTDVFTLIPDSRKYFNFDKNKDIDIYSIPLRNTEIPIDWKCPDCGYEWSSPLATRIDGKKGSYSFRGCHQCYLHSTDRITPVSSKPKLVKYWDFKKNKGIDINLTSAHSYDSVHWRDKKCGYEWEETIKSFNGRNDGCPFCDGKQGAIMPAKNDIFTLYPELASIFDFDTNERNGIDIYSLTPGSKTEVHFKCKKCGNEWDSSISNRIKVRNGKPVFVDCPECSNKSFRKKPYSVEYPDLAAMFRKDLNRIALDSIRGAKAINHTYYHWICLVCGETFESTLGSMTMSVKSPTKGCPYCSHTKIRKGESFGDVHLELIEEYDPENKIDIFHAFPNSKDSVKWICKDCGYRWDATFALRNTGAGKCPECYKMGRNIKEECFAAVYPEYVALWSSDNERTPYDTFYTSNLWIHWDCQNCGNVYSAEMQAMISGEAECPYCRGIRLDSRTNSLKVTYPDIARRWSDNNIIGADMVLPTSGNSFRWICDTCHGEYSALVKDVVAGIDECPYCKGTKVLKGFNSFGDRHPDLIKEMDEIANYLLPYTEFDVMDKSTKKFWWTCTKNPRHKYPMSPNTRLMFQKRNREPCLYCRGQRRKLNRFVKYDPDK